MIRWKMAQGSRCVLALLPSTLLAACAMVQADAPPDPVLETPARQGAGFSVRGTPYPGAQAYQLMTRTNQGLPFQLHPAATVSNHVWSVPGGAGAEFLRLQVTPMASNDVLAATLLNRLAYGSTPDEWARVQSIGPQAYMEEQLAPESVPDDIDQLSDNSSDWQFVSLSGTATSSLLYIYLDGAGEVYLDDMRLVAGVDPLGDTNLLRNADFEQALTTGWTVSANLSGSSVSTDFKHGGNASLHVVSSAAGTTQGSSIWQTLTPSLRSGDTYTLSYWYLPSTNNNQKLTVRLSGSGILSTHYVRPGGGSPSAIYTKLQAGTALIADLRAWHMLHAVRSRRQLLEVLDQFLENHFVTQYSKSRDFLGNYYSDFNLTSQLATRMEFREHMRWREALMNPSCTFADLLRISAESPAMIIYLDTVNSKGSGSNIANENYARELLELFSFGVDNGYDQTDIVTMSKAWTGWSVRLVDATNEFNPFAVQSTTIIPGSTNTSTTTISNLVGVWAFNYKSGNHNTNSKTIFPGKTVPARFGEPWAGRNYQLTLPARSGTNSIQDGYTVIDHLANQPFTEEFISVKLCRLLVHDDFRHGYDFTDPQLSPEGQLVKACMNTWENSSPRGQIRAVIRTICDSELFRTHGANAQKVKTPLEYAVSAIRALRSTTADGFYTADTDGYSLVTPLNRMGTMALFDRGDPDGFPETAPGWVSAGTLAERLRFVQTLVMPTSDSARNDSIAGGNKSFIDPSSLLRRKLAAGLWSDAAAVSQYFVYTLYPGEGAGNLERYQTIAKNFLDTADDGVTASPFRLLTPGSAAHDQRLRGMVALLMTLQRFQEQ